MLRRRTGQEKLRVLEDKKPPFDQTGGAPHDFFAGSCEQHRDNQTHGAAQHDEVRRIEPPDAAAPERHKVERGRPFGRFDTRRLQVDAKTGDYEEQRHPVAPSHFVKWQKNVNGRATRR